jgi:ABC-type tungstate transport system permease subunit
MVDDVSALEDARGLRAIVRMSGRLLISLALLLPISALAQDNSIVVASTTSTQDSGLFGHLLPLFTARTGIAVKVVALGTGQALDAGRRGDADVVFVHAKSEEERFVAEGFGVRRYPAMYNDFFLVGPRNDPAGVGKLSGIVEAFRSIKEKGAAFISRGDKSGTHIAELKLWQEAGIVNPAKHPHVKKEQGEQFIDWLISPEGQAAIKDYRIEGQPLFFPNAGDQYARLSVTWTNLAGRI